ncbi:MAG: SRPBCC domain-containing protein [Actinomycetota bacterium]|nr:SRPBCC domain-containing protein [Actinomycetota bacterium]
MTTSPTVPAKHGTVVSHRDIAAPADLVFDAWTQLEHRRIWFKGPDQTELERSVDLQVGGTEIAHGRFPNGVDSRYTARFHLIERPSRLVYAFDMHVAGAHFSVSLATVDITTTGDRTRLTYTEQAVFLDGDYGLEGRQEGTEIILDQFAALVPTLL